jgi:alkanesulfonate monooxygenase
MSEETLQTEPRSSGKQVAAPRPLRFHWSMSSAGSELKGANARASYNGIPDLAAHLAYCEAAEAYEIESLLTAFGFHRADPMTLAAALGVLTNKVKFMVAVRSGVISPTAFVQQVNTISSLTNGRICLNVVGGHTPKEQRAYGDFLNHDERYARTDEFLSICRAHWFNEGPVSFKGVYYEIEDAAVKPPFISAERRGPEIFLGGASDAALDLAVRHADCLWTLPRSPEEMAPRLQPVLESGTEVGLLLSIIARPSREEAVSDAYALLDRVSSKARQVHRDFSARSDSVAFTGTLALAEKNGGDWLAPWLWTGAVPYLGAPAIALVGSYDEVAEAIRAYEKVGINQFLFMGWPDIEEMKRFAGEVRPRLAESHALIPP